MNILIVLKNPISDLTLPIDLENWFGISEIKNKRQEIEKILKALSASQKRLKMEKNESGIQESKQTEIEPCIETKIETTSLRNSEDSMDFTESEAPASPNSTLSGFTQLDNFPVSTELIKKIQLDRTKRIHKDMNSLF